jgi:hypothetical protein
MRLPLQRVRGLEVTNLTADFGSWR